MFEVADSYFTCTRLRTVNAMCRLCGWYLQSRLDFTKQSPVIHTYTAFKTLTVEIIPICTWTCKILILVLHFQNILWKNINFGTWTSLTFWPYLVTYCMGANHGNCSTLHCKTTFISEGDDTKHCSWENTYLWQWEWCYQSLGSLCFLRSYQWSPHGTRKVRHLSFGLQEACSEKVWWRHVMLNSNLNSAQ